MIFFLKKNEVWFKQFILLIWWESPYLILTLTLRGKIRYKILTYKIKYIEILQELNIVSSKFRFRLRYLVLCMMEKYLF